MVERILKPQEGWKKRSNKDRSQKAMTLFTRKSIIKKKKTDLHFQQGKKNSTTEKCQTVEPSSSERKSHAKKGIETPGKRESLQSSRRRKGKKKLALFCFRRKGKKGE